MRISDQVSMCLSNLIHRKMRTMLTITGVIVGTCLIVIVFSLGIATQMQQDAMIAGMGDLTRIQVRSSGYRGDESKAVLDDDMMKQIAQLPGVKAATPIYNARRLDANFYAGKEDRYRGWADITGMYVSELPKMGYELLEGDMITGPQTNPKKPIYVMAGEFFDFNFEDTKKKVDNYRWPQIDETTGKLMQQPFVDLRNKDDLFLKSTKMSDDAPASTVVTREIKVAGRLKEDYNKEYYGGVIMDIADLKQFEAAYMKANKIAVSKDEKTQGYDRAVVMAETIHDVDAIDAALTAMGFQTQSLQSVRKQMQDSVRQQQLFLGILGGVSLVVAAIGITNTMVMSIYERTREIGVMKVLGCKVGSIRSVFLMEAGAIGFVGGCLGTGLSFIASYAMNAFNFSFSGGAKPEDMYQFGYYGNMTTDPTTMPVSVIPLWLVGVAILFATMIGLLAGIPPASRATKISALEAIKHE